MKTLDNFDKKIFDNYGRQDMRPQPEKEKEPFDWIELGFEFITAAFVVIFAAFVVGFCIILLINEIL